MAVAPASGVATRHAATLPGRTVALVTVSTCSGCPPAAAAVVGVIDRAWAALSTVSAAARALAG